MSGSGRPHTRDLIERVRYPNPIPLPPYPPKLIAIETPSSRYADGPETSANAGGNAGLRFTARLAQANTLPVLVDAEGGMPLDLSAHPGIFTGDLRDVAPTELADDLELDAEDEFLLEAVARTTVGGAPIPVTSYATAAPGAPAQSRTAGGVTWLRRTEYLGMEQMRKADQQEKRPEKKLNVDISREAQIRRIQKSFAAIEKPIDQLRHPTKPHLRATQSWDVLPDVETWATQFQVVRFGDWPGRTKDGKPIPDPRVAGAILRPVAEDLGQQRISLYLISPEDEDSITAAAAAEASAGAKANGDDDDDDALFGDDDEDAAAKRKRDQQESVQERVARSHQKVEAEMAERYEKRRRTAEVVDKPEEDMTAEDFTCFKFSRDYVAGEQDAGLASTQLVFVLDNGDGVPPQSEAERNWRRDEQAALPGRIGVSRNGKQPQRQYAYWHPIQMRYTLRQRRLRRDESRRYVNMWDRVRLGEREPTEAEVKKRWRERITVDELDERLREALAEPVEEDQEAGSEADADADAEADAMDEDAPADKDDAAASTSSRDADGDAGDESAKKEKAKADGSDSEAKADGDKEGRSPGGDGSDDDDDDDDDVESIDADEELKALAEEAGDKDDTPVEGRRRRRPAAADPAQSSGPAAEASSDDEDD